jgi:hypothetical protein
LPTASVHDRRIGDHRELTGPTKPA